MVPCSCQESEDDVGFGEQDGQSGLFRTESTATHRDIADGVDSAD